MLQYRDIKTNKWHGIDLMEVRLIGAHHLGFMIITKKDGTEIPTKLIRCC